MIQSRPLDIEGRFVGVAVRGACSWHFVAVDPVLDDLHGAAFASPEAMERTARVMLSRARGEHLRAARSAA